MNDYLECAQYLQDVGLDRAIAIICACQERADATGKSDSMEQTLYVLTRLTYDTSSHEYAGNVVVYVNWTNHPTNIAQSPELYDEVWPLEFRDNRPAITQSLGGADGAPYAASVEYSEFWLKYKYRKLAVFPR